MFKHSIKQIMGLNSNCDIKSKHNKKEIIFFHPNIHTLTTSELQPFTTS